MNQKAILFACGLLTMLLPLVDRAQPDSMAGNSFDVKHFGAAGDGTALDTDAINQAIDAASKAGGGTVYLPAGRYKCYSIHLKSNVTIYLDQGAVIAAAPPAKAGSGDPSYNAPEPNAFDKYQDFGHTHFHNSLIWGENIQNVAIVGQGGIDGSQGLVRGAGKPGAGIGKTEAPPANPLTTMPDETPTTRASQDRDREPTYPNKRDTLHDGQGDKAIALKLCKNVTLRDFYIFGGGHFGILATGIDNLTLDNLKIDTNRDGMDIDSCRNVRVSNCYVNSPYDDGICLKADYALGFNKPAENITITNCQVSGYVVGTLLDGTCEPFTQTIAGGNKQGPTGRIKMGTEANGGFRNVTISNCVFDFCRGLALEQVDGGPLEDVCISNITMRHVQNSPIFLRLGARLRAPKGTEVGTLQRINISNLVAYDVDPRYASIISGVPDHDVADIQLSHIQIFCRGGAPEKWATSQPAEKIKTYPEPSMFGDSPAYGFYIRHVRGIDFDDVKLSYDHDDMRSPFVLDDVQNAAFTNIQAKHGDDVPNLRLKNVTDLRVHQYLGMPDTEIDKAEDQVLKDSQSSPAQP